MLQLHGYISVWLALQVSHSDVVCVGLGGVAKRVVPSHSRLDAPNSAKETGLECLRSHNLTIAVFLVDRQKSCNTRVQG